MNKKKLLIVMIILGIGIIILGGTLAYWNWHSTEEEKTNVVFTVTGTFSCAADGGGDITSSDVKLKPTTVSEATSGNYIKREVKVKPTITDIGKTIYMDLWVDINSIGTGLSNSDNFMYAFTTSSASPTDGVVASGNFKDKTAGDKIELLSAKDYTATTTDTYYLWIWLDAKETNTSTMKQTFSLSLNGSCSDEDLSIPKVSTAETLIARANPSTLMYTNATDAQKRKMWTFSHEATEQTEATTDYRYIGNTPNNYITFNDEVWRIIGVFDGKIKIIRNDSIGVTRWDYKADGVGSSTSNTFNNGNNGSSDWTDSQLMYMLNSTSYKLKDGYTLDGDYIKDGNGNIIYQLGCRPAYISSGAATYSCTTNTWSLNSTALSQTSETMYYLGGISSYSSSYLGVEKDASYYYNSERGTAKYSSLRPTSWNGYVGLMYPSDYAYTFANGVDEECYNDTENCAYSQIGTPSNSWLFNSSNQWTLSTNTTSWNYVFSIKENGVLRTTLAFADIDVRPVVYLRPDIQLSGNGTASNPYEIIE